MTAQDAKVANSPVASGSGISQNVDSSTTVNVTLAPASVAPPQDMPDVLLQCDWPNALNSKDAGYILPPTPAFHIVRNRPWILRHLGPGAIYNIKIADIPFKGYVASFDQVDVLTDQVVSICPLIFELPSGQQTLTYDLESLISHPPPKCDISAYTNAKSDSLNAEIPISVTYVDKHGAGYKVRYVLHYDCWFNGGRMVRIPGIEKISKVGR